jgi:hypothetical protein
MSGDNNGMYGTKLFIEKDHQGPIPNISILNASHRYVPGSEPDGWITIDQWRDLRKNHNSPGYGRSWYNDGYKNHYLKRSDPNIDLLNLKKGRIRR